MVKSARRVAAATLYPRRLAIFDRLNANADFRSFVRQATTKANCFSNRILLYQWLNQYLKEQPIDYLEFGVAAGDSIKMWSELSRRSESRFFGFDTFEGLPEDWTKEKPAGTFTNNGKLPEISDRRVTFIKGLFQSTLYEFLDRFVAQSRLVVHIDCDIYSATLFCLAALDRRMLPGTLLLFDEFYDARNEFAAFDDYTHSFYREARMIAYTNGMRQTAFEMGGHCSQTLRVVSSNMKDVVTGTETNE
jgi:Methyltransferase domain